MKSNYENRLKSIEQSRREQAGGVVKRIWELTLIKALHLEFGFGKDRLKRLFETLYDVQRDFDKRATASDLYDRKKREMTNIDTALIQMIRDLRADGIDHREIIDDGCEIVITDEHGKQRNIDEYLDKF